MKKGQVIFNIIILLSVVALYILVFADINLENTKKEALKESIDTTQNKNEPGFGVAINEMSNLPIAYVNLDTLDEKYLFVISMRKTLENRQKRESKKLEKEFDDLQKEYMGFMKAVQNGGYTEQEAMKRDRSFQERSLKLEEKRKKALGKLGDKQLKLQLELKNKLTTYLKKYSEEYNYSYILGSGNGSNVLYASDSLDITREVLNGLNDEYQASKKK